MEYKELKYKERQKAQTFLEYVLLFSIVVGIVIALSPLMKRGIQATVKSVADQIGLQQCAEQKGGEDGKIDLVDTRADVRKKKTRIERVGNLMYQYDDATIVASQQLTNSGFTREY
jgi:hypothetical protein